MQKEKPKFEQAAEAAILWIRGHQEQFWAVTGASLLAILLVALIIHHRQTESDEAWTQLGNVQGLLAQEKYEAAQKGLTAWESRFSGTDASSYEKFIKADLLFRTSDYVQAAQVYGDLAETARQELMRPLALSAQASAEEMSGNYPRALSLVQTFLDRYPDHFLAGPRYITNARLLEITGDRAGAAAVYNRFILLYPQSPWTEMARARTQALGGTAAK